LAQDCWDAEVETTYGWVECVGLADRSAFDLDAHTKATGVDLNAFQKYDKPIEKEVLQVTPVMKELGKAYKKDGAVIKDALMALEDEQKLAMQAAHAAGSSAQLVTGSGTFEITAEQVGGRERRGEWGCGVVTPMHSIRLPSTVRFALARGAGDHRQKDVQGAGAHFHSGGDRALLRHRPHHLLHVNARPVPFTPRVVCTAELLRRSRCTHALRLQECLRCRNAQRAVL
jgi:hypothetical protein